MSLLYCLRAQAVTIRTKSQQRVVLTSKRKYATLHDADASPLSQSLDTKQRAVPGRESVGPFQLGLSQSSLKGEQVKKWSDLSTSGKVLRTTARTSNLTVILFGAGLSVLLIYSLTSELFSKNSPTVLYGDACERIKASPMVARYLQGPLTFHNNPPSTVRPRHRNHHVISQIMVDAHGKEHMLMTFYIQGRPPGSDTPKTDGSYIDLATHWAEEKLSAFNEMTLNEVVVKTQEYSEHVWGRMIMLFRYLSGSPSSAPTSPPSPPSTPQPQPGQRSNDWSFAGMFSALRGVKDSEKPKQNTSGRTYTDGQAHANFIRNSDGYFVFRYLLVDIPSSRDPNPIRVFVERMPGVKDNEPVVRWSGP